jgi:asparagine synthase (glutamine-hydrolysing)
MCGLSAVLALDGGMPLDATLERMLATIVHRGPDDAGRYVHGRVGLGFRRLSILDLSPAGHQPMESADGTCTIVFNGEIYNYVELREELRALGHVFRSSGDTDVLLAAYRQWGPDCLTRLNGMWAFVIHDRARNVLFGARDRFGIKPLFRWQDKRSVMFASEIKAIRASGLADPPLNLRTCAAYLHEGRLDETDETFYEGIVSVGAGHAFELDMQGSYREWAWWSLDDLAERAQAEPARAYAELFDDAMRLHMRSDVPVGVNLSGGLDSTSILCAAARIRAEAGADTPLLAFCYLDKAFDERRYIADTLAQTGAQMVPLELTPAQLWDSLPTVLAYQDEPVHSMTALVGFHLMGLAASRGVKVVLNGQGADEVMAGYPSYFHDYWSELIAAGRLRDAQREVAAYTREHGGRAAARLGAALRHALQSRLRGHGRYRALAGRQRLARARARSWISPDLLRHLPPPVEPVQLGLRDALSRSVASAPLPLYLRIEDRNSMAHSVEARVPFLDPRLVSLVFGLQSQWKLHGPWNKHLLREAMRGRIPESVRGRIDKMGFPVSSAAWFRAGPVHERLREVIHDRGFRENALFDAQVVAGQLDAHRDGTATHTRELFAATQLHLWQQHA